MCRFCAIFFALSIVVVGACQCESPGGEVTPPSVDDAPPVEASEFKTSLVEAVCSSYRSCNDDVFRGGVFHLFYLPVQMSFDDELPLDVVEDSRQSYEELQGAIEAQSPPMLPDSRCREFTDLVARFLGLGADDIEEAVEEGIVDYDAEAAGECIARLRAPVSLCERERKAAGDDFNMQQYRAIASRHESEIEAHYEPCGRVFSGTLQEEASCTHIYECEEGNCEWYDGEDTGRCGPDRRASWLVP